LGELRGWSAPSAGTAAAVGGASASDGPSSTLWRRHVAEVIPGLWIGNREAACNIHLLRTIGVQACVNVTMQPNLHPDHFKYLHIPVNDTPEQDLLPSNLPRVLAWVNSHITAGRTVLVYCHAGISRSASVMLGLLLHVRGMSLLEAWTHLKKARPAVRPNEGFCRQLCELERSLRGTNSAAVGPSHKAALVPVSGGPSAAIQSHRHI